MKHIYKILTIAFLLMRCFCVSSYNDYKTVSYKTIENICRSVLSFSNYSDNTKNSLSFSIKTNKLNWDNHGYYPPMSDKKLSQLSSQDMRNYLHSIYGIDD